MRLSRVRVGNLPHPDPVDRFLAATSMVFDRWSVHPSAALRLAPCAVRRSFIYPSAFTSMSSLRSKFPDRS